MVPIMHSNLSHSNPGGSQGNTAGGIRVGIDAANLRLGGGITHLAELLSALDPIEQDIAQVIVWGGKETLARLPTRPWLIKVSPSPLNGNLLSRVLWQVFSLSACAKSAACDVLFVPGGSYLGSFHPVVTMSQNLLPFEWPEVMRNGVSIFSFKMLLLRWVQSWSFHRSEGVIFLTQYAKNAVLKVTGSLLSKTVVIAHGLSPRFERIQKSFKSIEQCSAQNPFELIYVSNVDAYKHQLQVLKAVQLLRQKGYPIHIHFIGPGIPAYIQALQAAIAVLDTQGQWAKYLGQVPYDQLQSYYAKARLGIFASSCETFGIILLEKMAMGLPIVCSNLSSMSEILQDGGIYCDPQNVDSIAAAIERYLLSSQLQEQKSTQSYLLAQTYSWQRCAKETFTFIAQVTQDAKVKVLGLKGSQ